eukprot:9472924-Pyramimonas_sp.AAC.1
MGPRSAVLGENAKLGARNACGRPHYAGGRGEPAETQNERPASPHARAAQGIMRARAPEACARAQRGARHR